MSEGGAQEARNLPRERAGKVPRSALVLAILLWASVFSAAAALLPEQVPIHWSATSDGDGFARADNWVSKPAALVFLAMTFMSIMALMLLSRLVVRVPESINSPHKDWWMASGERLARYERLLREDLMLIVSATVVLLACIGVQIILAARTPDGATAGWVFWTLLALYFAAISLVLARMLGSGRYKPDDDATA